MRPGRYCPCGCGTPIDRRLRLERRLQPLRADAKWAGDDCATRWQRANPGVSKRDAQPIVVGRTKPERSRPSGTSVRVAARKAIAALADELNAHGLDPAHARTRATARIRPLIPPQHQRLIDD